jgi:hypothetical protein
LATRPEVLETRFFLFPTCFLLFPTRFHRKRPVGYHGRLLDGAH